MIGFILGVAAGVLGLVIYLVWDMNEFQREFGVWAKQVKKGASDKFGKGGE